MPDLVAKFVARYGRLPTEVDPDYLEMLRMTKYRILSVPDVSPGKCANCGASKNDGRHYVDIGLHIEWYGALFLCSLCLQDIVARLPFFDMLLAELATYKNKEQNIEILREQGVALRSKMQLLFEELNGYYSNLHRIDPNPVSSPSDSSTNNGELAEEGVRKSSGAEQQAAGVHKPTTKSTSSSRSKNIPSLAELINSES